MGVRRKTIGVKPYANSATRLSDSHTGISPYAQAQANSAPSAEMPFRLFTAFSGKVGY